MIASRKRIKHPRGKLVRKVGAFNAEKRGKWVKRTLKLPRKAHWVAVLYRDDQGNWGHMKQVRVKRRR